MFVNMKKEDDRQHMVMAPLVSINETDKEVLLEAEMPGLDKDNIELEVKADELTISGYRKDDDIPKGYAPLHRERWPYGYSRTFILGNEVDRDKISASYSDGVLILSIPKSEESQPRKIEIK